jgi:tetratricopeptide (TPR) repeat protein
MKALSKFSKIASVLALVLSASTLVAQHHHHGAEDGDPNAINSKLGSVHMPVSCQDSVQASFERGVALLHSFWFEEANKQFRAVAAADPQCAMAQWGVAMTEWRPLWDGLPDNRRLAGIAEIDKATALHAGTDRERRYIAALSDYLHSDPSQNDKATHAYADAMGALHAAYPDDVEATAFYGLALVASNEPRKALDVLEPGFQAHSDHPGFAHYIIHAADSPQYAEEGLPAAEKYAAIAPDSAHALHMPGHLFARRGMWQEDVDSNLASVRASEYAEKHNLGGVGHQLHAYEFLLYAYLQQGKDADARQVLDRLEPLVAHLRSLPGIQDDGMALFITYFQVEMPGIYYLELHDWKSVLAIPEPAGSIPAARYYRFWEQAIAAGRLRDAAAADKAAAGAEALYVQMATDGSPIAAEREAAEDTIKAWQSFAHKNDEEALRLISAAADSQDRVGQAEVDIPAREMYADMLMTENRPSEALVQYRTALKLSPNRFNALYNAGRAAEAAGKRDEARTYYQQLMKTTDDGRHSKRPEVAYARNFLLKGTSGLM